jgi:hypothetical protein
VQELLVEVEEELRVVLAVQEVHGRLLTQVVEVEVEVP